jgi:hypothetical protein
MAWRLPDGSEQNLQPFVNPSVSARGPARAQRCLGERMLLLIDPTAWMVDDVSVLKD